MLLATVYHLDSAVGDIVHALKETGQRDNTLILFSSDNGPWVNNAGGGYSDNYPLKNYSQPDTLRGKKLDVYEGGIHVAGFVNWPGKIAPQQVTPYVHIIDWFPTLAGLLDYRPEISVPWDGMDLSGLLMDGAPLPERELYWIWNRNTNRWALRQGDWKIVKYGRKQPEAPEDWQLFNLQDDPSETNNIASVHPEVVKKLHQLFLKNRALDYKGTLIESGLGKRSE